MTDAGKHTPGPWSIWPNGAGGFSIETGPFGSSRKGELVICARSELPHLRHESEAYAVRKLTSDQNLFNATEEDLTWAKASLPDQLKDGDTVSIPLASRSGAYAVVRVDDAMRALGVGQLKDGREVELTADFTRGLPGGKFDDSDYEAIEEALDRIDAPITAPSGRFFSLVERIQALSPRSLEGMEEIARAAQAVLDASPQLVVKAIRSPEDGADLEGWTKAVTDLRTILQALCRTGKEEVERPELPCADAQERSHDAPSSGGEG